MSILGRKLLALHRALDAAGLPHGFGGAIALAYCTRDPRGTSDLDFNVFVAASRAEAVLSAMPDGVRSTSASVSDLIGEGQVRIWWGETPLDVFLNVDRFHSEVASRVSWVPFEGQHIPILSCRALAVFKAMFDRPKDWVDIQEMIAAGALDVELVMADLGGILGSDPRIERLRDLSGQRG